MKALLLISMGLIAFCNRALTQCAAGGLMIQSPACEDPKNLKVGAVSCSSLAVKWQGNKKQHYLVKATFTDPANNNIMEEEGSNISCDDNGNCAATFNVKEHTAISWSVQSLCSVEGAAIHSSKVYGPDASIPFCEKVLTIHKAGNIHVYPNPSANYLNVDFDGMVTSNIVFRILDVAGKQVFNKPANTITGKISGRYKLDLHTLISGTYLLEVHNGNEVSQVKFVMLHKD